MFQNIVQNAPEFILDCINVEINLYQNIEYALKHCPECTRMSLSEHNTINLENDIIYSTAGATW
jgi:hypothetical protein